MGAYFPLSRTRLVITPTRRCALECTCHLSACLPHNQVKIPQRRALSPEHREILRRHEENDWPEDKTQYTAAETRLRLDAEDILEELLR